MSMDEVAHTHPHTNDVFGEPYARGVTVAADGGRADGSRDDAETETERMEDVHHEPPAEGVNRVFERGTDGRTDRV